MKLGRPPLQAQARVTTPLGPVTLAATAEGLAGLWFDAQKHHPGPLSVPVDPDQPWLAQAAQALSRYWLHPAPEPNAAAGGSPFGLQFDLQGSEFQRTVWAGLRGIEPGTTLTYGDLAAALGRPSAVRAVAAAVGRNPVSIFVPCHRVVGRNGSLTGYAGGLERKARLLEWEQQTGPRRPPSPRAACIPT